MLYWPIVERLFAKRCEKYPEKAHSYGNLSKVLARRALKGQSLLLQPTGTFYRGPWYNKLV